MSENCQDEFLISVYRNIVNIVIADFQYFLVYGLLLAILEGLSVSFAEISFWMFLIKLSN